MTLRLRRGTDLERQSITFQEGELVYITDTKDLYAGDGTTVGGIKVSNIGTPSSLTQNLNLNGYNIQGTGTISATSFVGDGSNLVNVPGTIVTNGNYTINIAGYVKTFTNEVMVDPNTKTLFGDFIGSHQGSLRADDSTLLVDANTGAFFGTFVGDGSLISNISIDQLDDVDINNPGIGEVLVFDGFSWTNSLVSFPEIVEGSDYKINIVGADSTMIVDYLNNSINANTASVSTILIKDDTLEITPELISNTNEQQIRLISNDNQSTLKFTRQSESDLSPPNITYGSLFFERSDLNGSATSGFIIGMSNKIIFGSSSTGTFGEENLATLRSNGMFGIGTSVPNQTLDVRGNGAFEGTVTAASFKGSVVADDSTTIVDAINGTIAASGYIQFGSYTTIERDAISASNGMIIYNSSSNRFQGYQNGAWINLDDGTAG
jgi:hypothetical protein